MSDTPGPVRPHTRVTVAKIPPCDVDPGHGPAYADAAIPGGPWGYFCRGCFDRFGCSLGLGRGQELAAAEGARDE